MLKNMKISTKLFAGFGLLICMVIALAIGVFLGVTTLNHSIEDLGDIRIPEILLLGKIREHAFLSTSYLYKAIIAENEKDIEKTIQALLKNRDAVTNDLESLKKLLTTQKGREQYQTITDLRKNVAGSRNKILALLKEGKKSDAIRLIPELETAETAYAKSLDDLSDLVIAVVDDSRRKSEKNSAVVRAEVTAVGLIVVFLGTAIALLIIRSITRPLDLAVNIINRVASGDLTVDIADTDRSETGQMLEAMRIMIDRLKRLIGDIKEASDSVASGSEQLSASSEEITRTMLDQSNRSSQIATSTEEMSQTVIDIAKNASNIAESSSSTAVIARNGAEVVEKSVIESRAIVETVNTSTQVMQSLGEKSKQIGDIINVINDIADQTNLLALNAAIEAARAGEQGRGFAVVADEVRKLAERTSTATSEISQMIGAIQGEVESAVNSMSHTNEKVNVGLQYSVEAGDQLQNIVNSVGSLQNLVQQIATATEEMSTTSESISSDIQSVALGAKEISGGSDQIAQSSSELARLAGQLKGVIDQFKV
ncbi:MAG: methyl-accepting chemotaxis protein [Dissulfurispiraceae bacterium]|jgi:methyl-accepting chemotaxis protein|nr:methyl-accepting chemotaxis protein [Dissulfurispiraceae bacterium]